MSRCEHNLLMRPISPLPISKMFSPSKPVKNFLFPGSKAIALLLPVGNISTN
ncbi:MAG: hypothetical protein F6K39_15935 [Okeania sp. SIO3B3]|nr:hypothetical protein [Okeania sp. SIO3B3]